MGQRNRKKTQNPGVREMVQTAVFAAVILIMAFTPFLGYIPLGFTRVTTIHIPVILGSLMLGPGRGAVLGGVFGLTSFINNTVNPTATSFVFSPFYSLGEFSGGPASLLICFGPRILIGVVPYYILKLARKCSKKGKTPGAGLVLAGIGGSLTNTLLVMNLIFVFFRRAYAAANEVTVQAVYGFILTVIGTNGVPEAIVAGVLTLALGKVLLRGRMKKELGASK